MWLKFALLVSSPQLSRFGGTATQNSIWRALEPATALVKIPGGAQDGAAKRRLPLYGEPRPRKQKRASSRRGERRCFPLAAGTVSRARLQHRGGGDPS